MSVDTDGRLGLRLSLEAAIGQLAQSMDGIKDLFHKFATPNPIGSPLVRPILGSITAKSTADTYTFIDMGGPASGRFWDLRRISVVRTVVGTTGVAADFSTQAASMIVNVIVAPASGTYSQVGATNVFGPTDVIVAASSANNPFSNTWSAHEATIRFPQHFIVAIKGAANSDNWSAWGQCEEYLESTQETVVA